MPAPSPIIFSDAFKCRICGGQAIQSSSGWRLCVRHTRLFRMRVVAQNCGKHAPTIGELEQMASGLDDMRCPHCQRKMQWTAEPDRRTQITLQHYNSGKIGLICYSCNSRHGQNNPDDDSILPPHLKRCCKCKSVLPKTEFYSQRRSNPDRKQAFCRPCGREDSRNRHRIRAKAQPAGVRS